MIKGFANLEDTREYFNLHRIDEKKLRSTENFTSLPIAIGTHLGDFSDEDSSMYTESVTYALENGINFIDTALNYRGMRSERDIAKALKFLIEEKKSFKREQVIISTKGGIIPGDIVLNLRPDAYLEKILIGQGIIDKKDLNITASCKHVLAPKYYEFAIETSKEHLGIETIDIHYIHDPEESMEVLGEDEFYKKLYPLFSLYEEQIEKGNIKAYGFATWTAFLLNQGEKGYISLEKTLEVAKAVAGDKHHFKFVQMPYNIKNNAAAVNKNQLFKGKLLTPFYTAKELGLNITTSAPLVQGEGINKEFTFEEALKYVTDTKEVYAAMVGMKNLSHVKDNLNLFI